jgi:sulfite reductase (ferredoxin)
MTIGYKIPPQLDEEIGQLEELVAKFRGGEISATELKAHRVPFGVYEQREPDTYMVRIRCVAGIITPRQLEHVARIASVYGVGDLHITSRQELQIHYVKLDDLVTVIRQLKEAGLSTRGGGGNTVRNIAAQDDAGIDPDEIFDVTPYASALTSRLITESDSWNLPRKYKIAFSGSAADKGHATLADLGFIAKIVDGKRGFKVYGAGGLGAKSAVGNLLFDFVDETKVYLIARAIKNLFWKYGNRKNKHAARLRFLWQSLGEKEFKKKLKEELDKIEQEGYLPLELEVPEEKFVDTIQDSYRAWDPKDHDGFILWKRRFVKTQKQLGFYSILLPVELGFLSCEKTIRLAQFLAPLGDDVLRMTRDQNFLLRNIPGKKLEDVYAFLKEILPSVNQPLFFAKVLSCAGASTCQLGICLSRQAARVLIKDLAASGLDLDKIGDIHLNISGCPNACGHHPAADLGFSGKVLRKDTYIYPGYNVYVGAVIQDGKTKLAELVGDVPAKALPSLVKDIFSTYIAKRAQFNSFRDYISHEGKQDLGRIILRYKDVPSFEEDKNFYFDWGADKIFSLVGRGTGECSAGLFDLIEVDLNNIRQTRAKLLSDDAGPKEQLLGELVFFACRALLITRGIDPKNDQEIFSAFQEHFILAGHIDPSFTDLIVNAQQKELKALLEKEHKILTFTHAIELLYENMDNVFNSKKTDSTIEKVQATAKQVRPVVIKDFRGVLCPMNFVKTKVELSLIKSGDILEVWLDDGSPIENVPGSVKAEGHNILAQKRTGDYWSVVIEKKGA